MPSSQTEIAARSRATYLLSQAGYVEERWQARRTRGRATVRTYYESAIPLRVGQRKIG